MTTKESLKSYVELRKSEGYGDPIFEIMLIQFPNKENIYPSGKHSGFPDIGSSYIPGFYYSLDDAIAAMNENICDIRECVYDAGFILCHFQGMYVSAGKNERMYFVWNDEKRGFYQQEEPQIFSHISY